MKKILFMAFLFAGQVFAAQENYFAADGTEKTIHFASIEEIKSLDESTGRISAIGKGMHISRVDPNLVRIVLTDGTFMFAGRQIVGVQPYQVGDVLEEPQQKDNERLDTILTAFKEIALLTGNENLEEIISTQANGPNVKFLKHVYAATVIIHDDLYNTYSFHEAMACLIREAGAKLATDEVIPFNNVPSFLLSYTTNKPAGDETNIVRAIELPINYGPEGWRWAVFAKIDGQPIPELPVDLLERLNNYRASQLIA